MADGARPVHYRRTQREGTRFGHGGKGHRFEGADLSREWIASMLAIDPGKLGLPEEISEFHEWTSPEAYFAWALAKRDPLLHRHGEVVGLLEKAGAVTKKERKDLHPKLEIEIRDQRKHDKRPLPPLAPWRTGSRDLRCP